MSISKSNCTICTGMPGGNNLAGATDLNGDLLLTVNGVQHTLQYKGNILEGSTPPQIGYNTYGQRYYLTIPNYQSIFNIPSNGATVNFKLNSLCQYPLFSGPVPPNNTVVGHLKIASYPFQGNFYGYDINIDFPPYNGTQNDIVVEWRGVFYADDSQFLQECQTNQLEYLGTCEFLVFFRIKYDLCPSCKLQTAKLPSTRISAIIDQNNVSWPLENGVFTDCDPNSTDTKRALTKIKEKLIEIDKYYGGCSSNLAPKVTATSISEGNYCLLIKAENFVNKFRAIEHSGSVFAYFNHDGC